SGGDRSGGDRSGGDRRGGDSRGGDSRGGPPSRGGRAKGRGGRFRRGRRHCIFCADKELQIDYKFVDVLEEFVSERGKIVPRRSTGTCAKHQRPLALSIKRARNAALLSYTGSGLQQRGEGDR
ncbi:MAG TPA: 30S ribosomal protein S18, partial [Deltaproteobacteria bacterium]|nr:30S ribosomal protein S18 [Deltaproteobacteria bacterium]